MNNYLEELFSTPTNLTAAYSIDGITFYSSDNLKQKFKIAINKSSKGKHISKEIENLIDKNVIIPCYKSKNVLSFIKHKLSRNNINKYISAFFVPDDKKVIVLIDNSSTIFGTSSNNELATTTIHECMHLAAKTNLPQFIKIFGSSLKNYYKSFYRYYLQVENLPDKNINDILKFLLLFERNGSVYAKKNLAKYFHLLDKNLKDYTSLPQQEFKILLTQMIVAAQLFTISVDVFGKNSMKFSSMTTSLNKAYKDTFNKVNIYTLPIQELISLSEVACVLSEMKSTDPLIKRLFKII